MWKKSRKSMRLINYDYSQAGAYFVSLCTQNRICIFGEINKGQMILNDIGKMIQFQWERLPSRSPSIEMDEFIVMPNHLHGIIFLNDPGAVEEDSHSGIMNASDEGSEKCSLGIVIGTFKSITTNEYIDRVNKKSWAPFDKRLWQRDFYDHIIRNSKELDAIRKYIALNPLRWELDRDNPSSDHKKSGDPQKII
jgi:putative transposase